MTKIAFTGDIMLARGLGERLKKSEGTKILSNDVVDYLKGFDFVVGNLECPFTKNAKKNKAISFKASPENLSQIKLFDLFSLANNHIFDCGKTGAKDTLSNLSKKNKNSAGLLQKENDLFHFETKIADKTFTFLSCAVKECVKDNHKISFPKVIEAESQDVIYSINKAKEKSHHTIILVHGGNEMIPYPEPTFRSLCESFIDEGADIVITHHPHVLGGVHNYKNKYIFYSLGDFIFDGESNLRRRGMILTLIFNREKVSYNFQTTQINKDLIVSFANAKNKVKIENKWDEISRVLDAENDYIEKYKARYVKSFLEFQLDRFYFLIKNKGVLYLVKFMFKKFKLMPYYYKKISSVR